MKKLELTDREHKLVLMGLDALKKESVELKGQISKADKPESILLEHYGNVFIEADSLLLKLQKNG